MANQQAGRDGNFVTTLLGASSSTGETVKLYADPTTHRLLVDIGGVASALQVDTFTSTNNQTVFTASTTPAATLYLSINGSIQTPSSDYTVSGSTATLASGIPSGNVVLWAYFTS
jgi:hypothetical protein